MKKLYEIEKEITVDVSKSKPFIVYMKINFNDPVFFEHVNDFCNRKNSPLDELWIISDTAIYYSTFIRHSQYTWDKDNCINIFEAIKKGAIISFEKEKHALGFVKMIDKKVDRLFKSPKKTYLKALDFSKAAE